MRSRRSVCAALLALVLSLPAEAAIADGDPASDFLLVQDVFFPYQPVVAPSLTRALNLTVARSRGAGFPIKVALIASAADLGAVPNLYGQPQRYASFLDTEIAFNGRPKLLVVMPQGFGIVGAGAPSALSGLSVPSGSGSNGLAVAAIKAVAALASQAGHRFTPPPIPAASSSGSGSGSSALAFAGPAALVVILGLLAALRRRHRSAAQELEETSP